MTPEIRRLLLDWMKLGHSVTILPGTGPGGLRELRLRTIEVCSKDEEAAAELREVGWLE